MKWEGEKGDQMGRLALCVLAAAALVYGAEHLCAGKDWPLWEKYGPWLTANKVQAIAVAAAVLYGASLALGPKELGAEQPEDAGFSPC